MIEKIKGKIKNTNKNGLFYDSKKDAEILTKVCNELIDKVNELTDKVNELENKKD